MSSIPTCGSHAQQPDGGSRLSTPEKTYHNLTPDPYYSDGKRAVLFFGSKPTPLDAIGLLKWESSVIDVLGR
ncbi:hypothetical protein [Thiolapillus sp.]|uniref:hypothetical protein n=1 Tax=Thiolapillus sp. TaxID=2017437 RepID=UPI003AF6A66C